MQKNKERGINYIYLLLGLVAFTLTVYVIYRIQISGKHLIPISVLAIIGGVVFESLRLSDSWAKVLKMAFWAFLFSFFAFLPGKREHNYNFETHIEFFPYWFIISFAILSIAFHGDKVVPKLTEGITLLQSIAVIYWVIDYGFLESTDWLVKSAMIIGILFALLSLFHAFSHAVLSRGSRLMLSIWSSIIMMLFAGDNIYRVYQNEQIENTADLSHGLYIGLQFFLLGVSCIYIIQNFVMLAGFLPGKGTFFNAQYFREIRELKDDHIDRYSDEQVYIGHSLLCVLFTGLLFALNYHYQVLPRHIAIWAVFVMFPIFLFILRRRRRY